MFRVIRELEPVEWAMQKEIAYDTEPQFPDD
jgi:hypothetical protein